VQLHSAAGAHAHVHGSLYADRLQQIHSMQSVAVAGGAQRPLQIIKVPHAHRVRIAHCARVVLSPQASARAEHNMDPCGVQWVGRHSPPGGAGGEGGGKGGGAGLGGGDGGGAGLGGGEGGRRGGQRGMGGEGGRSGGEDGEVEVGLDVEVAVGLSDPQLPPSHCAAHPTGPSHVGSAHYPVGSA
jgi:hypothetical protein